MHERLVGAPTRKPRRRPPISGRRSCARSSRRFCCRRLDRLWREHLVTLEHLRQVIGLRGYGQRDPLNEYKSESFTLFEHMLVRLREAVTGQLMHVELSRQEEVPPLEAELPPMEAHHLDPTTGEDEFALEAASAGPVIAARGKCGARVRERRLLPLLPL